MCALMSKEHSPRYPATPCKTYMCRLRRAAGARGGELGDTVPQDFCK